MSVFIHFFLNLNLSFFSIYNNSHMHENNIWFIDLHVINWKLAFQFFDNQ